MYREQNVIDWFVYSLIDVVIYFEISFFIENWNKNQAKYKIK